jgi:hypothetical protein
MSALTTEQLWNMRAAAKADPRCADEHWFILYARAIEAAHGIGIQCSDNDLWAIWEAACQKSDEVNETVKLRFARLAIRTIIDAADAHRRRSAGVHP